MTSGVGQPSPASAEAPQLPGPDQAPDDRVHPVRFALGVAVLVGERIGRGAPPGGALVLGVGLLQEGAAEVRTLARHLLGASARIASRAIDREPDHGRPTRPRVLLDRVASTARRRGAATIAAGRADASAFVRTSLTDGIRWVQTQAVPQILDGAVPYLVERVVPRLIDGVMPEIRSRVLPAVIDDLAHHPQLRSLVLEESKNAAGRATHYLRNATADADDRIENAVRHLGRKHPPADGADHA